MQLDPGKVRPRGRLPFLALASCPKTNNGFNPCEQASASEVTLPHKPAILLPAILLRTIAPLPHNSDASQTLQSCAKSRSLLCSTHPDLADLFA